MFDRRSGKKERATIRCSGSVMRGSAFDASVIQSEILHKDILPVFASSNIIQLAGVVK